MSLLELLTVLGIMAAVVVVYAVGFWTVGTIGAWLNRRAPAVFVVVVIALGLAAAAMMLGRAPVCSEDRYGISAGDC